MRAIEGCSLGTSSSAASSSAAVADECAEDEDDDAGEGEGEAQRRARRKRGKHKKSGGARQWEARRRALEQKDGSGEAPPGEALGSSSTT